MSAHRAIIKSHQREKLIMKLTKADFLKSLRERAHLAAFVIDYDARKMRVSGTYFGESFEGSEARNPPAWANEHLYIDLDKPIKTLSGTTTSLVLHAWKDGADFLWGSCREVEKYLKLIVPCNERSSCYY